MSDLDEAVIHLTSCIEENCPNCMRHLTTLNILFANPTADTSSQLRRMRESRKFEVSDDLTTALIAVVFFLGLVGGVIIQKVTNVLH